MKEHPILFTGEMVRAILAGQKTQTRRVVTARNTVMGCGRFGDVDFERAWVDPGGALWGPGPYLKAPVIDDAPEDRVFRAYSRVDRGDRLWVRETWSPDHREVYPCPPAVYRADGDLVESDYKEHVAGCAYERGGLRSAECLRCAGFKWRPSIFMPRWACRLLPRVTDVGVQRVQDIGFVDIRAEGVDCPRHDFPGGFCTSECPDLRSAFAALWDGVNGPRGFGWASNPWVWVFTFEVEAHGA